MIRAALLLLSLGVGLAAFAGEQADLFPSANAIVCRGEVYVTEKDMDSGPNGGGCTSADVYTGEVCFRGDAKWAAWALDSDIIWGDEEYIECPRVLDPDTVSVDFVDGPNSDRTTLKVPRCK